MMDTPNTPDTNGISFLGNTLQVISNTTNQAQKTLDNASQSISNINTLNAKSVDTAISTVVQQKLQTAQRLQSTPSPLQQLGAGIVTAAGNYMEKQVKQSEQNVQVAEQIKAAKQQKIKEDQAVAQSTAVAKMNVFFEETLNGYNEKNLWATEGNDAFRLTIANKLKGEIDLPPDAYSQLIARAYRTTEARDEAQYRQAAETAKLGRDAYIEKAGAEYGYKLIPITTGLESATTDEQAESFVNAFREQVLLPITQDPLLDQPAKDLIIARQVNRFNEAYNKKFSNYNAAQGALRQYNAAQPLIVKANQELLATSDQQAYKAANAVIDAKYPLARQFFLKQGEAQRLNLDQRKLAFESNEVNDKIRAANPLVLNADGIKYYAATLILDPTQEAAIEASLKNPTQMALIRAAKAEFELSNQDRASLAQEEADLNVKITSRSVNTESDIMQRALVVASGGSDEDRNALLQILALNPAITPEMRDQIVNKPQDAQKDARIQAALNDLVRTQRSGINAITRAEVEALNTRKRGITQKYPNLNSLGLYGLDSAGLQRIRQTNEASTQEQIRAYQERLNQQLQQGNINQTFNGQTPNFSADGNRTAQYSNPVVLGKITVRSNDGKREELVAPIAKGTANVFTSPRGMRNGKFHAGVDFAGKIGDRAVALVSGTVINTSPADGYGNQVLIQGDDGFYYRYGHHAPTVKVGQRVNPGDVVGTSDNSGRSTGAHLHFEVLTENGFGRSHNTVDPIEHLRKLTQSFQRTDNVKGLRQDTSAMTKSGVSTQKPAVLAGNGNIIHGNRVTNLAPGVSEDARRRKQPTTSYNTVNQKFTKNKPVTRALAPSQVSANFRNDPDANYNYYYLAENPSFRRRLNAIADELGTNGMFLADIISQESQFTPNLLHGGGYNNVGITGFGRTSGVGRTEDIVRMSGVEQLEILRKYILTNTKPEQRRDLRTLWASIRMGTILRRKVFANPSYSPKLESGKTYAEELKMLGRDAGREYLIPGYDKRSSSLKPNYQVAYGTGKSTLDVQLDRQGINNIVIADA
jgi:murein DD-endopeptidase MepM/ murein hydrolase activator NlpD